MIYYIHYLLHRLLLRIIQKYMFGHKSNNYNKYHIKWNVGAYHQDFCLSTALNHSTFLSFFLLSLFFPFLCDVFFVPMDKVLGIVTWSVPVFVWVELLLLSCWPVARPVADISFGALVDVVSSRLTLSRSRSSSITSLFWSNVLMALCAYFSSGSQQICLFSFVKNLNIKDHELLLFFGLYIHIYIYINRLHWKCGDTYATEVMGQKPLIWIL